MKGLEILLWFNTVLAITGTFLNAKGKRISFVFWMVTNMVFVAYNLYIQSYQQAALFSVYLGLALFGWISWGKKQKADDTTKEPS